MSIQSKSNYFSYKDFEQSHTSIGHHIEHADTKRLLESLNLKIDSEKDNRELFIFCSCTAVFDMTLGKVIVGGND